MKKISSVILVFFCICIYGCSIPSVARQNQLSTYYKEETKKKKSFFGGKKPEFFKDFREDEAYEEDIVALKEEAEKYISGHPDLSDAAKTNLRELKVTEGASRQEVELLLGTPDKVSRLGAGANYNATELWIYKISRIRAFTIFIVPICFVHEGYYLYFKDDVLAGIERHYLRQTIEQGAGPGVVQKKGGG